MALFRSLRFRITSMAMIAVVGVLIVVGVVILQSVKSGLMQQVDQGLINQTRYYEARLLHHQYIPITSPAGQMGQLFSANGKLLGASANLQGMPPLIDVKGGAAQPVLLTVDNPRYGHLRVVETQLGSTSAPILVGAQQVNEIFDANNSLTELLLIVLPLLAIALAVLIWVVVGRAMRRVEAIRVAVADISARNVGERVPSSRGGDELDRLAQTMNDMLGRLAWAFTRERRFVADASHELRSPIAALRVTLEAPHADAVQLEQSHRAALSALQRLDVLAEGLLTLESANGSANGVARELIDLDEVVLAQVEHLGGGTELELDVSSVSAGQVLAREVDMTRIVENLSSNALRHARSCVAYGVTEQGGNVWLTVADDGPGVPDKMKAFIFERFARLESDRNRQSGGAGLGLAIVSEVVGAYGGEVWVEDVQPRGSRFVVKLPATREAESTASALIGPGYER